MSTIIVIDDNQELRQFLRQALLYAGYSVMDWGNPRGAVDYLRSSRKEISLLIVDGAMPVLTGPEAAAEIRQMYPHVPVLLMSGHGAGMFTEFNEGEGHYYLSKPFLIEDFLARVASLAGEAPARSGYE